MSAEEKQKDAGSRRGRKAFAPTDEQRAAVRAMAPDRDHEAIAAAIGISVPTLRKHFGAELADTGPGLFDAAGAKPKRPRRKPARKPAKPADAGRPEHVPTADTRTRVELLVADGWAVSVIATALSISEPTLRKHYRDELEHGAVRKRAELLGKMMAKAREGNVSAIDKLQDRFDKAELNRLARKFGEADDRADEKKPEPKLGKKEAAVQAAHTAETDSSFAELIRRAPATMQ